MKLSRRQMLLALTALPATACNTKEPPPAPKSSWPRTTSYAGVEMIELFPGDADAKAPFVVAIHGRGDRPEHWVEGLRDFPARAHIVVPRAFDAWGDGYSWFKLSPEMSDEQIGAAVGAAEAKLWPGVVAAAAGRKIIATGFSQGGILSFTIAARHADTVKNAFPVSGACPAPLRPQPKAPAAPVLAFHGTADPLIPIQWDRESIAAFKASGNQADLKEYPGIGHAISPQMRADWHAALAEAITAA